MISCCIWQLHSVMGLSGNNKFWETELYLHWIQQFTVNFWKNWHHHPYPVFLSARCLSRVSHISSWKWHASFSFLKLQSKALYNTNSTWLASSLNSLLLCVKQVKVGLRCILYMVQENRLGLDKAVPCLHWHFSLFWSIFFCLWATF